MRSFYSNGKLLLTGEYLVLDGAQALAFPTKFGQDLQVETTAERKLQWESYDADGSLWLSCEFTFEQIITRTTADSSDSARFLLNILHEAYQLNPGFLTVDHGYHIITRLTFPRFWGLGSSSTLIASLSRWVGVDPYQLLQRTFGGSGYDIACANHNAPIRYQIIDGKPTVQELNIEYPFQDKLYFLYLNQKQNSRQAIAKYKNGNAVSSELVQQISDISNQLANVKEFKTFCELLSKHEALISNQLGQDIVQNQLFPDFTGVIKSLGAWGGDFVLVASDSHPASYFQDKGYHQLLSFDQMIL